MSWLRKLTDLFIGEKTFTGKQSKEVSGNGVTVSLKELLQLRLYADGLQLGRHKRAAAVTTGQYLSAFRGRGVDFAEVRIYQAGDDIRNMDWRVTARTGKAHTKLFQEERECPVFIWVDYSASMFFATRVAYKSVIAAKIAALLAWSAAKNGDRIGGLVYSDQEHREHRPALGQHGVLPLLKTLVKLQQPNNNSATANMADALLRLRRLAKPGSRIFLLSDFSQLNEASEKQLARLSQHNELVAIRISDPLEAAPPSPNHYAVTDGEDILQMDTRDKSFCQQYSDYFRNLQNTLKATFARYRIHFFNLQTDDDVIKTLQMGLAKVTPISKEES